jgi:hypothetical protein
MGKKGQVAVARALDGVGAIHRLQIVHAFTALEFGRGTVTLRSAHTTNQPSECNAANQCRTEPQHPSTQPMRTKNTAMLNPTQPMHNRHNQPMRSVTNSASGAVSVPCCLRLVSHHLCPLLRAPRYPSRAEDFLLGRSIGSAAVRNNGDGDDDEQQNDDDDDDDDDDDGDDGKGRHRKHGVGNGHDRSIVSNQREGGPADVSPGSSPIAAPSPPSPPRDVGVRATSGRLPLDDNDDDDDDDAGHQSEGIGSGHADQRSPSSLPREATRDEQPDSSPIAAAAYDDDDDDDDYYKSKDTTAGPEAGAAAVAAHPTQTAGQLLRQQLDKPVPKRRRASADDLDADIFGTALQLGNGAEAPSADKGREVGRTLE